MNRTSLYAGRFGVFMIAIGLLSCVGGVINVVGLISRGDGTPLLRGLAIAHLVGAALATAAIVVIRRRQRRRVGP